MSQPPLVEQPAHPGRLVHAPGDEALSAEAGIDAHQQHQVDAGQDLFERGDGRRRVDRHPGRLAQLAHQLRRPEEVRRRLDVHGHGVRARPGELGQVALRPLDHQVHVEDRAVRRRQGAQGLDHLRADAQVGHEVPVHDVDVDAAHARFEGLGDVLAQAGEVRREDGGGDLQGRRFRPRPRPGAPSGAAGVHHGAGLRWRSPPGPATITSLARPRNRPWATTPARASIRAASAASWAGPPSGPKWQSRIRLPSSVRYGAARGGGGRVEGGGALQAQHRPGAEQFQVAGLRAPAEGGHLNRHRPVRAERG